MRHVVVLGTGGTIAGSAAAPDDSLGYRAAAIGIERLLAELPSHVELRVIAEQVAQVDSKDMGPAVWRDLARRCTHWLDQPDVAGLVITHGTDTLEETAFFLQSVLAPAKPVVLTSAMRPATALMRDGPQNLLDAITVASTVAARGVVAVSAGTIHGAFDVAKVHPWRLDAFDSGDSGPLGHLEAGRLRLLRAWPGKVGAPCEAAQATLAKVLRGVVWPRVEIVMNHAGSDGAVVRLLVADGVGGIVVAATGNGSLSRELEAALLAAREAGVAVMRATRCAHGRVLTQPADALPGSQGLSPVKARVAMQLALLA